MLLKTPMTKEHDGLFFVIQMAEHFHMSCEIVSKVTKSIPGKNLGIHAHNDTENAVAILWLPYYQELTGSEVQLMD